MKIKSRNLLTVILALLCAVAVAIGVSFLLPKTESINASAAVAKQTVTYTGLDYKQWVSTGNTTSVPYSTLTAPNAVYGDVTFDPSNGLATISKASSKLRELGYVAFSATINVPALTEYTVTFSYLMATQRVSSGNASHVVDFFYYGNTADNTSAADKSAYMTFACSSGGMMSSSDGTNYLVDRLYTSSSTGLQKSGCLAPITITNSSNTQKEYKAFFGLSAGVAEGSTYANNFLSWVAVTSNIQITAINVPTVVGGSTTAAGSSATADYDINGNTFNFTFDHDRVGLTSVSFANASGQKSDITSSCIIDAVGDCTLYDSGTYTFSFDIVSICGAVWDSTTEDQTTKTLSVTINPKKVKVPTVSGTASQTFTGLAQTFALSNYDSSYVRTDSATAAISTNTVTAAGGGVVNDATDSFAATNADKYTVTLKLNDVNNSVWDDATGGTADRKATFEITKKSVTVPTLPQIPISDYDGVTRTLTLANYTSNGKSGVKIDSAVCAGSGGNTTITPNVSAGEINYQDAGTYTISCVLEDSINCVWADGSSSGSAKTLTFTIAAQSVAVPTVLGATQTYKADLYEFGLNGYDDTKMTISQTDIVSSVQGAVMTWDSTNKKFKATDAATYTVKFKLKDSTNYEWSANGGTIADQTADIVINPKELTISTNPAANSSPSWDFGATGSITVAATAGGITNANFEIEMYYIENGNTGKLVDGISGTSPKLTLDVSQVTQSGNYTLYVELTNIAANKNFSINNDALTMPFSIGSGSINFSVINWQYREDTGVAADLFPGGVQEILKYKKDSNGNETEYYITASTPASAYLQVDNSYNSDGYTNGFLTTFNGATVNCATTVGIYKTRVALTTDSNHLFDSINQLASDGMTGFYEISWEISKGEIDPNYLANLNQYLQYRIPGEGWQPYDPTDPPNFGNGTIEVQLDPTQYPDGVTGAQINFNDKNTAVGTYTATVAFTVDTSRYDTVTAQTFNWEIAAQAIIVDWASTLWTDSKGDNILDQYNIPYQIRVLNIDPALQSCIEYRYYTANQDLTKGNYVGSGDAGLQALTSGANAANSTNAVPVFVEAVLTTSAASQYVLKDNSGNNCALMFRLGATNTLVNVTQNATEMVYGESTFNSLLLTLIASDTNSTLGSQFVDGIYVYDSKGNNLGLLSAFDSTKASVGTYTIKIVLNAAGEETYTLSPGSTLKFTVKPKAIFVPTVTEIIFNNQFVNFADYLGGSWNDYKDIIKLGGVVDGVKNVGTYTATLTLLDSNYCWDYSKGIKPVKYSLTSDSNEMTCSGDDTVATYGWKISPYVLKASSWNLKGKEGAVYNIPAELTDGLDVDINYLYHPDKNSSPLGDGESLTAGSTYFVKAQLIGADKDNFVFEDSKTTTSDFATYKIPQSGAAQAWNTVKNFMTKIVAGLPVWAWFLIALAILILLIIIIVVAVKRRKTKEEREAKKAAKEEERLRKEEERQRREEEREEERRRREEERRLQQERLDAERELAKAKQEAELEKIRAQAQMAGAAGMATMAMQQPQQQPVQQVQTVDNDLLKEMREQMAELRADNKLTQAQLQALQNNQHQQQPQAMPMQMPMYQQPMYPQYQQMPMQMPMPMQGYGGGNDSALARMEAQLNAMQAEQRARYEAEQRIELAAFRAESHVDRDARHSVDLAAMREHYTGNMGYNRIPDYSQPAPQQLPYNNQQQPNSMDALGALVAATLKNMANGTAPAAQPQPVAEIPQKVEQSAPVTAKYPPDAVVTTTTTVDTTKNKPIRREETEDFDVDGFYETFE